MRYFKEIFGLALLLIIAGLIVLVGLGHVEEKTSYGLMPIIVCLAQVTGSYCNWAFGRKEQGTPVQDSSSTSA